MVQIHRGLPSVRGQVNSKIGEALGMSLGQGLGEFTGQYNANKALESVLNDEELKKKPLSERWGALQTKLAPHGKFGQAALQSRLQIEQQAEQEKVQGVLAKYNKGAELTEEEEALIPVAYRQKEMELKNKPAAGGTTSQPIPKETGTAINQVLNANKDASADDLAAAFAEAGVPPIYSNTYVETRRRKDEADPNYRLKVHEQSAKAYEDIEAKAAIAKRQLEAAEDVLGAVKSGNISPNSISNLFRGHGNVADKIADAFLNPDETTIQANLPYFIEGFKDVFGVRLTDADLRVIQDKLPSMGKNAESNEAILRIIQKYAKQGLLKQKISNEIINENKGYRPIDYTTKVNERFDSQLKKVKVKSPSGKIVIMPFYEAQEAIKPGAGGELIDE